MEDPQALPSADPAADPAASIQDLGTVADPASGGDTPPAADPNVDPAADPAADPNKGQDMVPRDRLNEVIEERNLLRENIGTLSRHVETLTTMVAKSQEKPLTQTETVKTQDALDALIESGEVSREDAIKLQKIVDAMGYAKATKDKDPEIEQLKTTVRELQAREAKKQDDAELAETLKKFEGVITEEQLTAKMVEFAKSKDPALVRLAQHGSYDEIAKAGFFDEIVQAEVAKATKGKPPVAPKVEQGKQPPVKTPKVEPIVYDPKNPKAYEAQMRAAVVQKLRETKGSQ